MLFKEAILWQQTFWRKLMKDIILEFDKVMQPPPATTSQYGQYMSDSQEPL